MATFLFNHLPDPTACAGALLIFSAFGMQSFVNAWKLCGPPETETTEGQRSGKD